MTLGFIVSFIVTFFGICIYLVAGIAALITGAATKNGRQKALEVERELRERVRVDFDEYLTWRVRIDRVVRNAIATRKDPVPEIISLMPDDLAAVFGDDYEEAFREYFSRHQNFSPYDHMIDRLALLQVSKLGQGNILQKLDFDEDNFSRSLRYCQVIEQNWRTAGVDIHFELRRSNGKHPECYMFPTEACYHVLSSPDFRW